MAKGLLALDHARLRFGGIVALDDVSLEVAEGSIVGLIGPNGAGKTTAFNAITRLYRLDSGDVVFDGSSLRRVRPIDPRDQVEDGRLAGAVRADQPDDLTLVRVERDVVERDDPAEPPRYVLDRKQCHGSGP